MHFILQWKDPLHKWTNEQINTNMLLPSSKLSNGFSLQLKSNLYFLLWLTKHYMIWLLPIFLSYLFHAPVCSSHTGHLALPSHPPINLLFPLPKILFCLLRIAAFIISMRFQISLQRAFPWPMYLKRLPTSSPGILRILTLFYFLFIFVYLLSFVYSTRL